MSESLTKKIRDLGLDTINEDPTYMPNIHLYEDAEIRPRYPIHESENSFEFNISGLNDSFFIIPSTVRICGVIKVRKAAGGLLSNADGVSCVNLFPHALFESISTFINDKQVSCTGRNAHHKAFITHNFGLNDSAKIKAKTGDFFLQNTDNDRLTIPAQGPGVGEVDTSGFGVRMEWIQKDKIRFNIPLTWDLASTKYIGPGHSIKLVFDKNRFNIPLLARDNNKQLKIIFTDLKLRMRRFRLEEPGPEVVNWYITKGPQKYPINRVQMRRRAITHGATSVIVPALVEGEFPWHLLCMIVHRDQMTDLNKDPFCYETHNLRDFQWIKNSLPNPNSPLVVDDNSTDTEGQITTYKYFQSNMGFMYRHADTGPSMKEYFSNQFVMAWNLPMCNCVGAHDHEKEKGIIDLKLTFNAPANNLDLLVMAVYESQIRIDKNGLTETNFVI